MRLTLRTLLAYLDDTLPASEAKSMGEKLAESEPAQEIVERIKNVIRRRRLTVPPATSRIDPNTIAEYLDNEITPELAEELERICLASDVHLAEVSACHQILSLVLGEPTAAPDEAVKRMYALGKGDAPKTPKKTGKAAAHADKPVAADRETDETLRMGLPSVFGKDRANRIMIFAGAGLASLLLVVAIMQLLPKPAPTPDNGLGNDQIAKGDHTKKTDDTGPEVIKVLPKPEVIDDKKPEQKTEVKVTPVPEKVPKAGDDDLPPPAFASLPDKRVEELMAKLVYGPPSTKVTPLGQLLEPAKDQVSIVVQQIPKTTDWKRLTSKQADLLSARPLVSLPGSKAVVVTKSGVRLTLWGNIPEQIPQPPLQESMVELYDHETLDLDMTLHRGRIMLANLRDDPIVVRIRFENPSEPGGPEAHVLLTLSGKNAEALIDRWSFIPLGEPFFKSKDDPERKGPVSQVACMALSGTVVLKTPNESATLQPPPNTCLALWSSPTKKLDPIAMPSLPKWLDANFVAAPEIVKANAVTASDIFKLRGELQGAFTGKAVDVGLAELMKSSEKLTRNTAVRCLGAIDDLPGLLDALNQDKVEQRDAAIETVMQWIGTSRDNDYKFYDLLGQRLKKNEADTFIKLLHGFSQQDASRPETYEWLIENLRHSQLTIRELTRWNLYRMVPAGQTIPYDAADAAKRERGYQQWLKLIPPGKMPPAPKTKAAVGPRDGPRVGPNAAVSWIAPRRATLFVVAFGAPYNGLSRGPNPKTTS